MQCIKSQVLPGQTQVREGESRVVKLLTDVAVMKVVPGNSRSANVAVSQYIHKTDGRGWCNLGGQVLYFTTHRLGFVFNLSRLLRNFFFECILHPLFVQLQELLQRQASRILLKGNKSAARRVLLVLLQRVVVGLPALQLLEAEEALRHVGAVLDGAVHEARRRHPVGRAGAALGEGPVAERGDAGGDEVEPPRLGQRRRRRHGLQREEAGVRRGRLLLPSHAVYRRKVGPG